MATAIYTTLISKILTSLQSVTKVKEIFAYPATKISKYPAVIYFPDSFENSFETIKENLKVYRFKLFVVIGTEQKSLNDIFGTVLPNVVDDILAQFDQDFDAGTIDGHRTWLLVDTGQWTLTETKDGLEAVAELNLRFKLITNN